MLRRTLSGLMMGQMLASSLWLGVSLSPSVAQAQEFDFTKPAIDPANAGTAAPTLTDPANAGVPSPPVMDTNATGAVPPALDPNLAGAPPTDPGYVPADPSQVPAMPILPEAQAATGVPPIPTGDPSQQGVLQPADPYATTGAAPLPPVDAGTMAAPTAPMLPIDPSSSLPAAAAPFNNLTTAPIPVVPTTGTSPDAYSYQRIPGVSPGTPASPPMRGELAPGTTIPLTVFREITFPPFQAINGNLEVSEPVVDQSGQVVIPAGSVVWGMFEPVVEEKKIVDEDRDTHMIEDRVIGTRFVANRITVQSSTYMVNGASDLLDTGSDPTADVGTVALRGAGYGAGAGLVLGVLTGGIGFLPIIAGSAAGAAAGTTNVDRVVSLKPNTIVTVQLADSLVIQ
jgi:hypothetical protein